MKIPSRKIVAQNVRAIRLQKNVSQEELADLSKLHRTYIGTVERAESSITVDSLDKISAALNVETWELLKP
ncbi:MAG: helix-turn-helix transcriptional regulator [Pseudomonadota bacterium]